MYGFGTGDTCMYLNLIRKAMHLSSKLLIVRLDVLLIYNLQVLQWFVAIASPMPGQQKDGW